MFGTVQGSERSAEETGSLIRESGQDSSTVVLAGGIGPHESSRNAVRIFLESYEEFWRGDTTSGDLETSIENLYIESGRKIGEQAGVKAGVSAVSLFQRGREILFAWHGNSRLYLYGNLERKVRHPLVEKIRSFFTVTGYGLMQLSEDHTFVQFMASRGQMDAESAEAHPNRKFVLSPLGREDAGPPGLGRIPVMKGDLYLLLNGSASEKLGASLIGEKLSSLESSLLKKFNLLEIESVAKDLLQIAFGQNPEQTHTLVLLFQSI